MTLAVFLSERLLVQARSVLSPEYIFEVATSWEQLQRIIAERPVRGALVDPAAAGNPDPFAIQSLLAHYTTLPVIAYVMLSPPALRAIAELSRSGLREVVLHRFDDTAEQFRRIVARALGLPIERELLVPLQIRLSRLPVRLHRAVENMFAEPHRYSSATDLALGAQLSLVRMYRSFEYAGLPSPKKLLIAARVLRASAYLADEGFSIAQVSLKLGYRQSRILVQHTQTALGLIPRQVRRLPALEVARLLRAWLDEDTSLKG